MSGNQKQAPTGAPQQQPRYQQMYPGRTPAPQRADAFHVTTTPPNAYVQQQASTQPSNQGGTMRAAGGVGAGGGMPPTGPPNQASTPPQTAELKALQSQPPMQVAFMPQQMRSSQPTGTYFQRGAPQQPGQTSGGPRMAHTHQRQAAAAAAGSIQPIFPSPLQMYAPPTQTYQMSLHQYSPSPRAPVYFPPSHFSAPMLSNAHLFNSSYPSQQTQPQLYYPAGGHMAIPGRPGPASSAVNSGGQQGAPTGAAPQPMPPMQQPMAQMQKPRARPKAIPIIDPETGRNVCEEESQPPSGDSSARETPQPPGSGGANAAMFVSAEFAARVAMQASSDVKDGPGTDMSGVEQSVPGPPLGTYSQPPPSSVMLAPSVGALHRNGDAHRLAETVHNSKLQVRMHEHGPSDAVMTHCYVLPAIQANIKEFVPDMSRHAMLKESATPVVSANTDGVEVTLPTKQNRDRDSPLKTRKHQQHSQHHHQQQQQVPQQLQSSIPQQHQHHHHQQQPPPPQPQQQPPPPVASQRDLLQSKDVTNIEPSDVSTQLHEPNEVRVTKVISGNVSAPVVSKTKIYSSESKCATSVAALSSPPVETPKSQQPPLDEPPVPNVAATPAIAAATGKSRGGQRNREPQAAATATQQQPLTQRQSVPVPITQPPKSSSKANRARELNTKGASKEGTDMDAFDTSDSSTRPDTVNSTASNEHVSTVSAPVVSTAPTSAPPQQPTTFPALATVVSHQPVPQQQAPPPAEPVQQQPQPPPPSSSQQIEPQAPSVQQETQEPPPATTPSAPKIDQHQPMVNVAPTSTVTTTPSQPPQKLPDMKSMPKPRVDVTSIVKDDPRPMRPMQAPVPVPVSTPPTDTQDDMYRVTSDMLVQAKNEANTLRTNSDNEPQIIDKTIRYKKDQWSPLNKDGKKCYDRDFLMCLQHNPKSKRKPENLPDLEVVLKENAGGLGGMRPRVPDPRAFGALNRQSEPPMPMFHKSLSQRGTLPKRNSQQGKVGGGGKSGSNKPNPIHVTLSLREDVKLRETENAWRPARLNSSTSLSEYEAKTQELYKKVRGVLNKLTPEKFDRLLSQVKALTIDSADRLQGVIDLVFDKAVDEPNFSVAYALMCKELALKQVPSGNMKDDQPEYVNFRKLLINRCQQEFENSNVLERLRESKQKEIDECTDPEKKKELQLMMEEDLRRLRVKSVGTIRFIGELFKQQMLTIKIMVRCITILLESRDEEGLECLCKLLTTVGKDLETDKNQNLEPYFNQMEEIVEKKPSNISSRVRFMLQDVIDLRKSKWVPRRQDLNPKTIEQIQKEADTEQFNIQAMNAVPMNTPRKDDRGGSVSDRDRKRRNQTDDGGWSMAPARNRPIDPKLVNVKAPEPTDMTFGCKQMYGGWGRGSNIKLPYHAPLTNTTNMYAALENMDADKSRGPFDLRLPKDPYVAKGHSMERATYKQHSYEDGRGSRSGSQQRQQPQQQQQQQQQPQKQRSLQPATPPLRSQAPQQQAPPQPVQASSFTKEQFEVRCQNTLDEVLNDCCSLEECEADVRANIDPARHYEFVTFAVMNNLERSQSARQKVGKMIAHLVRCGVVSSDTCCRVIAEILSQADDLRIDIPMIWLYLAELLTPLVVDEPAIPLERILEITFQELQAQGHAHKLLAYLLKLMVEECGHAIVAERWRQSGARLSDFVAPDSLDAYVKEHKLEYLMGGAGAPVTNQSQMSWEQVHAKLLQFFKSNTPSDTIIDWISSNVGDRVEDNQFIRTLVTAIVENAVITSNKTMKLRPEVLKNYFLLLQRYIDTKESYELQTLFALQALIHKWEHPPGLLLAIFERFWEDGVLSNESFLTWEEDNDPAEQEGKGVALKSLQSLFTALKEPDDESGSTISGDD